jgi:Spy/CpxP family protein refolding chaperone
LVLTLILVLAAGITGAIATKALSEGFGPGPWHRGGFMGGPVDPARVIDHADRAVRHLAIEIDATGEQQDQLRAIVKSAVDDILPMRDKVQAARQQARDLLTRPAVDRAEIERLRSEQVGLADAFSRRVAQALGDAAEILTPEQRRKINDLLPPAGGYWRGWHRG